jgi:predicted phage tail protein
MGGELLAKVFINVPLLVEITGEKRFHIQADSVAEALEHLENTYAGFKTRMYQEDGSFQGHLLVSAKYAGESNSRVVKGSRDDKKGLMELHILPVPHGG